MNDNQPIPFTNFQRILSGVAVVGAVGAGLFIRQFNPTLSNFYPKCPLYLLTGFYCPGCGLTRAFHSFLHFDFVTALDFNVTFPIYLILGLYLMAGLSSIAIRGRGLSLPKFFPNFIWCFFAISIIFGIVRNIPIYPFSVLAP